MSGAPAGGDEEVRSAVPVPDLTSIDDALRGEASTLKAAVKQVRPADLGRDLSRRPIAEARAILDAIDDRRGAAMLRAAHPVVAAQLLAQIDAARTCRLLGFLPTDHVFGRLGGSDGAYESFAYTEVDNTVALGGDLRGTPWHRDGDKLGLAAVSNGLGDDHRLYLALGGKGFLLGDGRLRYGRETIVEAYYTARASRGVFVAADLQGIANPGYNRDRGPIVIGSLRLHLEL